MVKLQHGEYISLGKVESELKSCSLIDNMCMYADPTQMFAVALVTPNVEQMKLIAEKSRSILSEEYYILFFSEIVSHFFMFFR